MIPTIVDKLWSSSRSIQCKSLETLRVVVEDDANNTVVQRFAKSYLSEILWYTCTLLVLIVLNNFAESCGYKGYLCNLWQIFVKDDAVNKVVQRFAGSYLSEILWYT